MTLKTLKVTMKCRTNVAGCKVRNQIFLARREHGSTMNNHYSRIHHLIHGVVRAVESAHHRATFTIKDLWYF